MKKKLVILTGAGMSAESGISTFRDSNGLWENHDIKEVASPEGWRKNPALVLDFYNKRRAQLKEVTPNRGHEIIAELEQKFDVQIITQNVDNLHERAGSSKILHLHGELTKVRSTENSDYIINWSEDLHIGDMAPDGSQLRPHIVWFGEAVPGINQAIPMLEKADILIIIGTSLQVYPAAGLMHYTRTDTPIYYIDPKPASVNNLPNPIEIIPLSASEGMKNLVERGI
ncbi:NAD-dependent deacylase [Flavobacterium columnare]|uniref:NAD-dependent protein deacylase n=1 Tax=Flavobacterium columnare (strain ATCC 49512 / CIP 103533 / TG 44/87) TaxID=1041826 RepID=G8XB34_FLACA|nr:NAD-dependent deacylase [Flavobacterium columnare]AEW86002.1 silent information regulator protein Sir2 [Flavobacterium columnare ATCC 49512]ANO48768.1 silent information regulator protein Sir2 [Flavobacterium columnare]APT23202.1 NAD-dependent deacylase [Flavobacterium columnare]PDS22949.1 NAD-dependent deacylase [Flavobacterium columnare] [Flavobacterium columnare NBRC 100251 = ATCC 23463]GEM56790.1 NAD-dependent protein deacylase [Flavobacterium columnare NBRC 100251 = ATCC 23463]